MKTKMLALWMLLAFLLGACGGGDDPEDEAECGNGVVEAGEECDEESEACDACKRVPGWECPPGEDCFRVEICDNGVDDDENELVDCADPSCETDEACMTGCQSQAACMTEGTAVEVCVEGICRTAATFEGGEALEGQVGIVNQFDPARTRVNTIKSYSMEYFHPAIPGSSEPLTCERLAEEARAGTLDPSKFNLLRFAPRMFPSDARDTYLLRDSGVLVTSDEKWVVLTRFYEGHLNQDADRVTGRMIAFSCVEDLSVLPGSWDPARQVEIEVQPSCTSDAHCAEGWECMPAVGLCAYRQCDPPCDARVDTCRELEGKPTCLAKCQENNPCDPGFRCDQTPGWEPACFPL